jgi:hypothetical protein
LISALVNGLRKPKHGINKKFSQQKKIFSSFQFSRFIKFLSFLIKNRQNKRDLKQRGGQGGQGLTPLVNIARTNFFI